MDSVVGEPQLLGGSGKRGIARPKRKVWSERDRGKQMCVDIAKPLPHEPMILDENEHFVVGGDRRRG